MDIKILPVIKTGALQVLVRYLKTERLDQMERCSRRGARSRYVSRVLRYLRFVKYDVDMIFHNYQNVITLVRIP